MKHKLGLFVVIAALALLGCSKRDKFLGTWEGQVKVGNQTATISQTLNGDKTVTGSINMEVPQAGKVSADVSGTWESKSEAEITTTIRSVTVKEAPAMIKEMFQKRLEQELSKPSTSTVTWNGDDVMVAKGADGNLVTFKRRK